MGNNKIYSILLALVPGLDAHSIQEELAILGGKLLSIQVTTEPYRLIEELKRDPVDLLIVSPCIISDPMVPIVRQEVGQPELKVISYCTTLLEDDWCVNFDGKILMTDSYQEMYQTIENVLSIENEEEQLLTPREKDVVIAVVKGLTNKEIADELFLSTHTVITHRRNIARKLDIHSASGLTIYAIMNKLVSLDDIKNL